MTDNITEKAAFSKAKSNARIEKGPSVDPKQVASTTTVHSFSPALAQTYGLVEAVILHHLQFWIQINRDDGRNLIEGRTWMYQSQATMRKRLSYLTKHQIYGALERLEDEGVIISGNFNSTSLNRTKWYAFGNEEKFLFQTSPSSEEPEIQNKKRISGNRKSQPETPISENRKCIINTLDTNTRTTTPTPSEVKKDLSDPTESSSDCSIAEEIPVYDCLEYVAIDVSQKVSLTAGFPEEVVTKAVQRATAPGQKIKSSLAGLIFHYCQHPEHIAAVPIDPEEEKYRREEAIRLSWERNRSYAGELSDKLRRQVQGLPKYFRTHASQDFYEVYDDDRHFQVWYRDREFKGLIEKAFRHWGLLV